MKNRKNKRKSRVGETVFVIDPILFEYKRCKITADEKEFIIIDDDAVISKRGSKYLNCVFADGYEALNELISIISERRMKLFRDIDALTSEEKSLSGKYSQILKDIKQFE